MTGLMRPVRSAVAAIVASLALAATPLLAQGVETIDPNSAIDGDLTEQPGDQPVYAPVTDAVSSGADAVAIPADPSITFTPDAAADGAEAAPSWSNPDTAQGVESWSAETIGGAPDAAVDAGQIEKTTYGEDDLIGAAEGVFGDGAEGLAKMIQKLLAEQGEPNGYIVGREAGGAFIVGARYGSGTLYHKVEGERPVYWTGPSIGLDAGANAGNTFVLVYNLYDTEQLYERFPAGEGQAYLIGGVHASYLRKGDTVLIPIRVGAGLRLGVNAGYLRFSKKQRWLPF